MIFSSLINLIDLWIIALNQHAFDLSLDTNNFLLFTLSYVVKANHFFPVLDAYFPIFGLYVTVYLFMGTVKIVGIFTNVVRGSGANI